MTFAIDVHHTTLSTFVHMSHVTHIMLRVSGVLSYTCLMQQKVAPLTLRRFPVTIHRELVLTAALVMAAQLVMALCVHWAARSGVTPREPVQVIHYTHAGCEERPALSPVWKAPRTP